MSCRNLRSSRLPCRLRCLVSCHSMSLWSDSVSCLPFFPNPCGYQILLLVGEISPSVKSGKCCTQYSMRANCILSQVLNMQSLGNLHTKNPPYMMADLK